MIIFSLEISIRIKFILDFVTVVFFLEIYIIKKFIREISIIINKSSF